MEDLAYLEKEILPQIRILPGPYKDYITATVEGISLSTLTPIPRSTPIYFYFIENEVDLDLIIELKNEEPSSIVICIYENSSLERLSYQMGADMATNIHDFSADRLERLNLTRTRHSRLAPDAKKLFQDLFDESIEAICLEKKNIKRPNEIIFINKAFRNQIGYALNELRYRSFNQLIIDKTRIKKKILHKTREGDRYTLETKLKISAGEIINIQLSGYTFNLKHQEFNFYGIKKIGVQANQYSVSAFFNKVQHAIKSGNDLLEKGEIFLEELCRYLDFDYGEGWVLNIDQSHVRNLISFSDDKALKNSLISQMKTATLDDGLPGVAWRHGQLVELEDLPNNPFFKRKNQALKHGLRYGLGIPLFHNNEFLGLILLLSKKEIKKEKKLFIKFFEQAIPTLSLELERIRKEFDSQSFFLDSPAIHLVITQRGKVVKFNRAFSRLLDKKLEIHKEFRLLEILDATSQERFTSALKKVKGSQKTFSFETTQTPHLNADLLWSLKFNKLLNCIYCSAIDISEQKRSESFLNRANRISKMGHWEVNLEEGKVLWSPEIREILGLNKHTTSIEDALQLFPGLERTNIISKFQSVISGTKPADYYQGKVQTFDGKKIWIRGYGEAVFHNTKCIRLFGSLRDISSEMANLSELKQTKTIIDLAGDILQLGFWEYDLERKELEWDSSMYQLFNADLDTCPIQIWEESVVPEDHFALEILLKSKALKEVIDFKFRIQTRNGKLRYILTRARLIKQHNTEKYIGFCIDITQRELKQKKVRHLLKENESILNSITDAFIVIDKNCTILRWNAAAQKLSGLTEKCMLGQNILKKYPSIKNYRLYNAFQAVLKRNKPVQVTEYIPIMDIWYEAKLYPHEEQEACVTIYIKDVTNEMKSKLEIKNMKNFQNVVINSSPDLIWAVNPDQKLIMGNTAYYKVMNHLSNPQPHTHSEAQKNQNQQIQKKFRCGYKEALKGEPITMEIGIRVQDQDKYFKGLFEPIYHHNFQANQEIMGVACFMADVTERKLYIKRIENQNSTLRSIAWKQSHLARAPLARLLGLVNLIEEEADAGTQIESLKFIKHSAEELDQIIREIADELNRLN